MPAGLSAAVSLRAALVSCSLPESGLPALAAHRYSRPDRAATCLSSTHAGAQRIHVRDVILSRPPARPGKITPAYHYGTITQLLYDTEQNKYHVFTVIVT